MTTVTVNETTNTVVVTTLGPAGPAGPAGSTGPAGPTGPTGPTGPSGSAAAAVRGQVSKMDAGTIDIVTQGVYVSTGLTGTFDSTTADGMTLGTSNAFAVKNTSGGTKLMQIYGSIDAKTASGNNKVLGIKLAKNGTVIDQTECRAFTGSGNDEAKLVTNWMISMAANDEVSLFIANHSSNVDITLGRARLVAVQVFA